jgi:hypothetical protein
MLGEESGSTEDVLRSIVEPSQNAKRGVYASVMSIGWWDAPAVTPRTPAPLTHTGADNARADKEGGTSIHPLRTRYLVAGRQTSR